MKIGTALIMIIALPALAACGNVDSAHLVFGQQQSVGLDITTPSASSPGGSLSLGYKDKNIAVVPVAVKGDNDTYMRLGGANKTNGGKEDINDSYSTIGQFELNAGENGKPSVGLGKFFATGVAAQYLADGFRKKLAGEK